MGILKFLQDLVFYIELMALMVIIASFTLYKMRKKIQQYFIKDSE